MSQGKSKINELIQIVDEHDQPISAATKPEAWKEGLIHRVVRILVEDKEGRLLLQKRSATMQLYPNCWDQSASGHVDAGEEYDVAAARELAEEVGLRDVPLQEIGYYFWEGNFEWRKLRRFNKVYKVVVPSSTNFTNEEAEVAKVQWFTQEELKDLVVNHKDQITDGLQQIYEKFYADKI